MEALIAKAIDTSKSDYAVIAGVQIHSWPLTVGNGPPLEYLWPKAAYAVVNGERKYVVARAEQHWRGTGVPALGLSACPASAAGLLVEVPESHQHIVLLACLLACFLGWRQGAATQHACLVPCTAGV